MKTLFLADLKDYTKRSLIKHLKEEYRAVDDFSGVNFLVAYESVGPWGCDSSSWFLFEKEGKFYEVHGSHCSCYGFEDQWKPEETTLKYLTSGKFDLSVGGYGDESHRGEVKSFLYKLSLKRAKAESEPK